MSIVSDGNIDPTAPEGTLRAERRRRILESAQHTFLRDGFRQATMDRVADDAGVSKQTLYNYFADKEQLFASLLELRHDELLVSTIEAALGSMTPGSQAAALQKTATALFEYAGNAEIASLHRIIIEVTGELPDLMNRLRSRFFLQNVERVRLALDRGAEHGLLRPVDAEATAYFIFGIAASYALFHHDEPGQPSPQRMAGALADLLGQGLIATNTDQPRSAS